MSPLIHPILVSLWTVAGTAVLAALAKILASKDAANLVKSWAVKLAAETESLIAVADHTHNVLLVAFVRSCLTYLHTHPNVVGDEFKTKADFVIAKIEQNPKLAPLGVSAVEIEMLVEELLATYFGALDAAAPVVQPNDVTQGGPGKP